MAKWTWVVILVCALVIIGAIYAINLGNDEEEIKTNTTEFNYSEGLILMQNPQTGEYNCFGCNDVMCVDPAPIMEVVNESEELYCDDEFNVVKNIEVVVKDDFGSKIVYEPNSILNVSDYEKDCAERGGEFSTCGSPCAPDAEICILMCAFTCENIE